MYSDFDIIVHKFPNREDLRIYPIFDLHLSAKEFLKDKWNAFVKKVMDDSNAYVILGGDLLDWGLKNSVTSVYDQILSPSQAVRKLAEMLRPLAPRVLCGVPGNHEARSKRDIDYCPIADIMCKLDIEHLYRENMAVTKLQFGNPKANGMKNPTYLIAALHGAGGGGTTGSGVNRGEKFGMYIDGIDAICLGHTHRPFISPPFKLKVDSHNNRITQRPFLVITASSWLSYGGYALRGMMQPSSHIPQYLTLSGTHKQIEASMVLEF